MAEATDSLDNPDQPLGQAGESQMEDHYPSADMNLEDLKKEPGSPGETYPGGWEDDHHGRYGHYQVLK